MKFRADGRINKILSEVAKGGEALPGHSRDSRVSRPVGYCMCKLLFEKKAFSATVVFMRSCGGAGCHLWCKSTRKVCMMPHCGVKGATTTAQPQLLKPTSLFCYGNLSNSSVIPPYK